MTLFMHSIVKIASVTHFLGRHLHQGRRDSRAGSLFHTTGIADFEDGSRIGNQPVAEKSLQRNRMIPEINITRCRVDQVGAVQ